MFTFWMMALLKKKTYWDYPQVAQQSHVHIGVVQFAIHLIHMHYAIRPQDIRIYKIGRKWNTREIRAKRWVYQDRLKWSWQNTTFLYRSHFVGDASALRAAVLQHYMHLPILYMPSKHIDVIELCRRSRSAICTLYMQHPTAMTRTICLCVRQSLIRRCAKLKHK